MYGLCAGLAITCPHQDTPTQIRRIHELATPPSAAKVNGISRLSRCYTDARPHEQRRPPFFSVSEVSLGVSDIYAAPSDSSFMRCDGNYNEFIPWFKTMGEIFLLKNIYDLVYVYDPFKAYRRSSFNSPGAGFLIWPSNSLQSTCGVLKSLLAHKLLPRISITTIYSPIFLAVNLIGTPTNAPAASINRKAGMWAQWLWLWPLPFSHCRHRYQIMWTTQHWIVA